MPISKSREADLQTLAGRAVQAAKERFGQRLDYSERSLTQLDALLAQAYAQFCELDERGELSDGAILLTARIWGSYLGEVVRRKWGGLWSSQDGEPVLRVGSMVVDPLRAALEAATDPEAEPVSGWYARLEEQLKARGFERSASAGAQETAASLMARASAVRAAVRIPPGIKAAGLVAVVLLLLGAAAVPARRAVGAWQFNYFLSGFLEEGERLAGFAGQAGEMGGYTDQLDRVQWYYARTGGAWPPALTLCRIEFEEALRGWDLALQVWERGQTAGPEPFRAEIGAPGPLLNEASRYAGVGLETGASLSIEAWLEALLLASERHFTAGRAGM